MRISYLLEVVLAVAVGLGLSRWSMGDPVYAGRRADLSWGEWAGEAGQSFFAGIALVGGLGVWIEALWRRSPNPWGPGRWLWSLSGAYVVLVNIMAMGDMALVHARRPELRDLWRDLGGQVRASCGVRFLHFFAWALLAYWISAAVAPRERRDANDAREWAGRAFSWLAIASAFACRFF